MKNGLIPSVAIAGISHHGSDVAELEAFRFPDEMALLAEARERFKGALLLQTCNRIEFLVEGSACMAEAFLHEHGRDGFRTLEGEDALRHLLRLSAGIDSMVVGEDQILGQLKAALALSRKNDTCSPLVERCITKAVHVSGRISTRGQSPSVLQRLNWQRIFWGVLPAGIFWWWVAVRWGRLLPRRLRKKT